MDVTITKTELEVNNKVQSIPANKISFVSLMVKGVYLSGIHLDASTMLFFHHIKDYTVIIDRDDTEIELRV